MNIIETFEVLGYGAHLLCAEMSDGSTWVAMQGSDRVYTTDDAPQEIPFKELQKELVCELPAAVQDLDQFVGHVNHYINY